MTQGQESEKERNKERRNSPDEARGLMRKISQSLGPANDLESAITPVVHAIAEALEELTREEGCG